MTTPHADLYEYEVEKPDRIPNTWVSVQRSPLIVYLHGIGESGGDRSDQVRTHGPWKNEQFNLNVKGHLGQYFVVAPHLAELLSLLRPIRAM